MPAVLLQRAAELDERLAELGRRMGDDGHITELRARLAERMHSSGNPPAQDAKRPDS